MEAHGGVVYETRSGNISVTFKMLCTRVFIHKVAIVVTLLASKPRESILLQPCIHCTLRCVGCKFFVGFNGNPGTKLAKESYKTDQLLHDFTLSRE